MAKRPEYDHKEYKNIILNKTRDMIRAYKESKACMDCDRHYPYYVMDFDHRDPSTKIQDVGKMLRGYSLNKVLLEMAKCDLVCANCHRFRTFKRSAEIKNAKLD